MSRPSTTFVYACSALCIALGVHSYVRPRDEFARFGIPVPPESSTPKQKPTPPSTTTTALEKGEGEYPLMHVKGIRDLTYGIALGAMQYQGLEPAVTIMVGVLSLAGLGDGFVVWMYGGERFKGKLWGHWGAFVVWGSWALWRALS
ncbi:hypothetical protein F4677DRAFT_192913 [Hypoxylon crocopeplum]|nr:hypothetical protein F4677DRAFT_192913 [Hypoxylon crocopeplum]